MWKPLIIITLLILLVPTVSATLQNFDFGGAGGIYASRCQGSGAVSEDGSVFYDNPCPGDFAIITTDTDLDTSDDIRIRILNDAQTDRGFALWFFDISNITFTRSNMTLVWEGLQNVTTDPIDLRVYNYANSSYETCNNFEPASVDDEQSNECAITTSVSDYINATNHVSLALFSSNDDAGVADTWTDYVRLQLGDNEVNNTFVESTALTNDKFFNITFRYENNNTIANASIDATFNVRPDPSGFTRNNYPFTSTEENDTFTFSYIPANLNISNEMTILFDNHGSQTRTFSDTLILTNSTFGNTVKTLYLLPSVDGIFVTFQLIDVAERPIQDVTVTANRSVGGTNTEVQKGTTGSAGTISFFLDPDIIHTFTFSKTGFASLTSTFAPTQTLYTITMGSTGGVIGNQSNFFQGIDYTYTPSQQNLINDTYYNFSFNINSNFWGLDVIGFRLFNGTGHFFSNTTCAGAVGTGCNATLNISVGVNSSIIMNAFWNIDGNITNVTRLWNVFIVSNRTGVASFTNLRRDMEILSTAFGTGVNATFTKGIISFLIILFGTGALAFRTGQFAPFAILLYMAALTTFLDLIGMLPVLVGEFGGINGITILVWVLAIIAIIAEQKI